LHARHGQAPTGRLLMRPCIDRHTTVTSTLSLHDALPIFAESLQIGWWITSALESNVGLNAICQFTANYPVKVPQGLGTGMIYERSEEHTSELQSRENLVCRRLLERKND